jgi:DnaJ-class molecular chaperone
MEESYYSILKTTKTASQDEIKSQWKKLSREYHPDKIARDKKEYGEEMIKKINEAYSVLSDPEKRNMYDQFGLNGLNGNGGPNMGDILNKMFRSQQQQPNIAPVQIPIELTLNDIFKGTTIMKTIIRSSLCEKCNGTGSKNKKNSKCQTCNGKGLFIKLVQVAPGFAQHAQMKCTPCHGTGKMIAKEHLCECDGEGVYNETVEININVEPGLKNGDIVLIENQGHYSSQLNKRGPLAVIIHEKEHEMYKRGISINDNINVANLLLEVELSLEEALCGFYKELNYLDNDKIYLHETDIIKNADVKILPNYGLPYKGKTYKRGNLYIKFKVNHPDNLTDDQKKALYKILTNKEYTDITISDDKHISTLKNINAVEINDDDDDNTNNGHEKVECRQQ